MNAITPFVFEDQLVRTVSRGGEPWFAGKDVCGVLDIRDHHQALGRLDDDERGGYSVPTPSGTQEMIIISEPGVFRLIFTSRKPEAERFKRWLAHDVLPQLRKTGRYAPDWQAPAMPPSLDDAPAAAFTAKLSLVREARLIWGTRRAQALWQAIGLPLPPLAEASAVDDAHDALRTLLQAETGDGVALVQRIHAALDGDTNQEVRLSAFGIKAVHDGAGGFLVANRNDWLTETFKGSRSDNNRWPFVLRRLPGCAAYEKESFAGRVSRTTFIPAKYLDMDAFPRSGS